MAFPVRLRHPKGVSTINVDPEGTIAALQQSVFASSEIPPASQEFKAGYPPRSLTLIAELPVSSLGLQRGDQLIVSAKSGGTSSTSNPTASASSRRAEIPSVSEPAFRPRVEPRQEQASTDNIRVDGGFLIHRVVPDDNSCLFSSIGVLFEQDMNVAPKLRKVVAEAIRNDMETWNEVVLGYPREQYINTILKPSSWGGAIELSVFSEYFKTEISSFDVETGRCDRFGEGKWDNRAILIYSGIHYDAVSLAPSADAPIDFHQTVFPVSSQSILEGASKLATALRAKKAYTNTSTFDLRCQVCKKGLKGEKEARSHASETGHVEFGEY